MTAVVRQSSSASRSLLLMLTLAFLHESRGFVRPTPWTRTSYSSATALSQAPRNAQIEETAPSRPVSSLPKRRVKKTSKKKRNAGPRSPRSEILDEHSLAEHVSQLYTSGPGGILYNKASKNPTDSTAHLDRHPSLVLNADYQPMSFLPLSLWHWQEAVKAIFSGKVTVVDVYEDVTIRAANLEIPLPSVIALNEYVPKYHQTPAFTKRNVFLRDEYRCQYCNEHFHTRDLSIDHVVPRCQGGLLHWENAVTSCHACNGRKGSLRVEELRSVGMRLLRPPRVPSQYELASIAGRMLPRRVHATWEPYLGMAPQPVPKRGSEEVRYREDEASL